MNYPRPVTGAGPTILAIAADGVTVLESYDIEALAPIVTPNGVNAGAFRGITRPTADIRFLQIANAFAAVHSFTVSGPSTQTAVPEPATFLLLTPALLYLLRRHNC